MGFMPIAKGLPVSFTQQLCKHRRIMKHTQGTIHGWTLHLDDARRVAMASDTELVLEHMPLKLYVKKRTEDPMPQHMGLEPQVYAVSPKGVNWNLDKNETLWIRRFGFPLRPDFASTVHAVTGDELDAAMVNLGDIHVTPRLEMH